MNTLTFLIISYIKFRKHLHWKSRKGAIPVPEKLWWRTNQSTDLKSVHCCFPRDTLQAVVVTSKGCRPKCILNSNPKRQRSKKGITPCTLSAHLECWQKPATGLSSLGIVPQAYSIFSSFPGTSWASWSLWLLQSVKGDASLALNPRAGVLINSIQPRSTPLPAGWREARGRH